MLARQFGMRPTTTKPPDTANNLHPGGGIGENMGKGIPPIKDLLELHDKNKEVFAHL